MATKKTTTTKAATPAKTTTPAKTVAPAPSASNNWGATTKTVTLPSGQTIQALDVGTMKPPAALEVGMVSPSSWLTITGTERNMAKEREAMNIGYTPEYIASRGGINSQGYFNDTPLSGQLTAAEQRAVTKPDGTVNTQAMADILQKKQIAELVSQGMSEADATKKITSQYGQFALGGGAGGAGGAGELGGAAGDITGASTTGGPTLAQDTFVNTLKLIMGEKEGSKPYISELYKFVSKFYKSGSTIEEAINLSLYQAKKENAIPEFTNRFRAIFAMEDLKNAGKIIDIPTIAEYVKSEEKLADVLNQAGLQDLATQTNLADFFSTGRSVAETTGIITDTFNAIDNAPKAWKENVAKVIPFADRTTLAKALLMGSKGISELQKTVARVGVQTAAQESGLTLDEAAAVDLLGKGETYGSSRAKFGKAASLLTPAQKLAAIETGKTYETAYTQAQAISATFDQSQQELSNLAAMSAREAARFSKRAGTFQGSLASQARGAATRSLI